MNATISRAVFTLSLAIGFGCVINARCDDSPLVRRDAVVLKLEGADVMVEGALKKAAEMNLAVNISVVDSEGHLLAFARMDGARPASVYTSMSKAGSAALKLGDTGLLGNPDGPTDTHLNLAVENAAMTSGGKFTTLQGGNVGTLDGSVAWKDIRQMKLDRASQLWESDSAFGYW